MLMYVRDSMEATGRSSEAHPRPMMKRRIRAAMARAM
jgi:hypothetical protein